MTTTADPRTAGAQGDLPSLTWITMKPWEGPVQRVDTRGPNIGVEVDGVYAGHIYWDKDTGEVTDIYVVPSFQRRGIGSALWEEAKRRDPNVKHSDEQTGPGKAWSQHVGRDVNLSEQMIDMELKMRGPNRTNNFYGSIADILKRHGKRWDRVSPTPYPGMKIGPMGQCYSNALFAAINSRGALIYCEGLAQHSDGFFPMPHGWCVDGEGTVFDPTWNKAYSYWGIPFDTKWLAQLVIGKGTDSVFGDDVPGPALRKIITSGLPSAAINAEGRSNRSGIEVEQFRRRMGRQDSYEGVVAADKGPQLAYRGFGSWEEARYAITHGRWTSRGMFTVPGEGQTQMALSLGEVIANAGYFHLRGTGFLGAFEADVAGLPFRTFVSKPDVDAQGRGRIKPDLGLGIGIDSGIPLDRIKKVFQIDEHGKVVKTWDYWDDFVHALESLTDNPDWSPELEHRQETQKIWVGWNVKGSKNKVHRLMDNQSQTYCGKQGGGFQSKARVSFQKIIDDTVTTDDAPLKEEFKEKPRRKLKPCEICFKDTRRPWVGRPVLPEQSRWSSLGPMPEGITFEHVPDRGTEGRGVIGPGAMISAKVDGEEIAGLAWFTTFVPGPMGHQAGQVEGVYVHDDYQRRGIASEMWRRAQEIEPRLHHSHALTEEGRAWSQHLGFPSWRDRGERPEADVLIVPDLGRHRRNSYSVYRHGQPAARRDSLAEAKAYAAEHFGVTEWEKAEGDRRVHLDEVWGWTPMFNDAEYYLVPKTGAAEVHCDDCDTDYFVDSPEEIEEHHRKHAVNWGWENVPDTTAGAERMPIDEVLSYCFDWTRDGSLWTDSEYSASYMDGLVDSVRQHGMRKPAVLRRNPDGSILCIDGNHRAAAAKKAGEKTMPVVWEEAWMKAASTSVEGVYFMYDVNEPLIDTKPMHEESSASFQFVHPQIATGGAIRRTSDLRILYRRGVRGIVSGRRDFDDSSLAMGKDMGIEFLDAATKDDGQPKPVSWFKSALDFCLPIMRRGGKVYIHCHSGVNRGPSLAYCVLRAWTGMGHEEAVRAIESQRDIVRLIYTNDADKALFELGYIKERGNIPPVEFKKLPRWMREKIESGEMEMSHIDLNQRAAAVDEPQWLINGKPFHEETWIEVEPDVWYRGTAYPNIPARFTVQRRDDKWVWQAQVLTFIGAPHEDRGWDHSKSPKGTAKTLEAAQAKAEASIAKDHEFFRRYDERQKANLAKAAAKDEEPEVIVVRRDDKIRLANPRVQVKQGTPHESDYRRVGFTGKPWRLWIEDPDAPGWLRSRKDGKPMPGNFEGSTDKTVAFLDVFDVPDTDWTYVAFMTTRGPYSGAGDYTRQGLAGKLMQAAYDKFAPKQIIWGRIMHDDAQSLKNRFRQQMPERTGSVDLQVQGMGDIATDKPGSLAVYAATDEFENLDDWRPTKGMYSPGKKMLDPRIFDPTTEQMHADVRKYVMDSLDAYWTPKYGDWQKWTKVYLAGSGASYWWESDTDLDILLGIDLDTLREMRPANKLVSDSDVFGALNKGLIDDLRPGMAAHVFKGGEKPFAVTYFANPGSWDIKDLHPYAAYDISADTWVTHPPVLPDDWGPHYIPDEVWRRCQQLAREAEEILSLPEPERTAAGITFFDWMHEGRRAAYSAYGQGWLDPQQIAYQFLEQHPHALLRRLYLLKHPEAASPEEVAKGQAGVLLDDTDPIEFLPEFQAIEVVADYNMGYYFVDWSWQDRLDRQAGGRNQHDLTKKRTIPLLQRLAEKILADHGHSDVQVEIVRQEPGESEAEFEWNPHGTSVLRLHMGNDMRNKWTLLHEMAHGLDLADGGDEAMVYDNHGPLFQRRFTDLLRRYGDVEVDLSKRAPTKTVATRTASYSGEYGRGGTIYRGLRASLPPEVDAKVRDLLAMETNEASYAKWGPHGGKKVQAGELIVRALEKSSWDAAYGVGLGRHWTERREMAAIGAQQGGRGDWGIILTATYDPSDVDPESDPTAPFMATESEVTLLPGAPITITGVEIANFYGKDERVSYKPIQSVAAAKAGAMFGFDDDEMADYAERWGNLPPHIMHREYDDAFLAMVHGIPVGQITYEIKQDQNVYSEDEAVAEAAKGDYNGYYLRVDALAVDRHWRRKGIGRALLKAFIEYADRRYGFLGESKERKGWDPGQFTVDGAALWQAVMHEQVPVTQRIQIEESKHAVIQPGRWFHACSPRRAAEVQDRGYFPADYRPRFANWAIGVYLSNDHVPGRTFGAATVEVVPTWQNPFEFNLAGLAHPPLLGMIERDFTPEMKADIADDLAKWKKNTWAVELPEKVTEVLTRHGYDGMVIHRPSGEDWGVVFDPTMAHVLPGKPDSMVAMTTTAVHLPTMWHVTTSSDFVPSPEYAPQGGEGMGAVYGKGLFLTPNPELWSMLWRSDYGVGAQYAAEVDVSALDPSECYQVGFPDRDQWWVPAAALDKVKVKRTVPIKTAASEAKRKGYGFAMLSRDAIEQSRLCVVDHKKGWGNPTALCGGVTDGTPVKWTTLHEVATGQLRPHTCPECLAKVDRMAKRASGDRHLGMRNRRVPAASPDSYQPGPRKAKTSAAAGVTPEHRMVRDQSTNNPHLMKIVDGEPKALCNARYNVDDAGVIGSEHNTRLWGWAACDKCEKKADQGVRVEA